MIPEDMAVRGNVLASGNETEDRAAEDAILERLSNGDDWAWCTVVVKAKIEGIPLEGTDSLGGCTYESEKDFKENSGYFEDMRENAADDLLNQIKEKALRDAAPEMLEALESILNDNRLMNALSKNQARAVMHSVAKARGES